MIPTSMTAKIMLAFAEVERRIDANEILMEDYWQNQNIKMILISFFFLSHYCLLYNHWKNH
jgi:hypothetical protein